MKAKRVVQIQIEVVSEKTKKFSGLRSRTRPFFLRRPIIERIRVKFIFNQHFHSRYISTFRGSISLVRSFERLLQWIIVRSGHEPERIYAILTQSHPPRPPPLKKKFDSKRIPYTFPLASKLELQRIRIESSNGTDERRVIKYAAYELKIEKLGETEG